MPYHITAYTRRRAKQIGVRVQPSTTKGKKIDVFDRRGTKVASVGAYGMNDFPTYIQKKGLAYAKSRRRLYRIRHRKEDSSRGTASYYAKKLLW